MSKPEEINKPEYHVYGIFNHSNGKAYIGLAAKPLKQAKDHLAKKGNRLIGQSDVRFSVRMIENSVYVVFRFACFFGF